MADYRLVDAGRLDRDLTAVADAIRERAGTSDALAFPEGMAAAVAGIEDYLSYVGSFAFDDLNIFGKPVVDLKFCCLRTLGSTFSEVVENTTVEHITVTSPTSVDNINACFYAVLGDRKLKHITLNVDTSAATYYNSVFLRQRALEIIDGTPLDPTNANALSSTFGSCEALKEVRFAPQTIKVAIGFPNSTQLSADTITSVINGLSPDISDLTATFTTQAVDTAFETAAGAADGSASAEWLALIGTKPNWTIILA